MAQGRTQFSWRIDKEFFGSFENSEIIGADLAVEATVEKSGHYIGLDCEIDGYVTVLCDRCLEDLNLPIHSQALQSIKFGDEPTDSSDLQEGGREIVFVSKENTDLDLSQTVYDYVCTSIPMLRVHEDGECNPETVKYLNKEIEESKPQQVASSSPFASLKDLLGGTN